MNEEDIRLASASAHTVYTEELDKVNTLHREIHEAAVKRLHEEFKIFLEELKAKGGVYDE